MARSWNGAGYVDLAPLLVEECLTLRLNGKQVEVLEGVEALALLQAPPSGNVVAEHRAALAEEDHRRVRQASLGSGEALRMRFRCEPTLPVDVIGVFLLLPAPQL